MTAGQPAMATVEDDAVTINVHKVVHPRWCAP
jgi:hypothetical protein